MFHFLSSLTNLLVLWAGTPVGVTSLAMQPRDPNLAAQIDRLTSAGQSFTGVAPNSDAVRDALLAMLG